MGHGAGTYLAWNKSTHLMCGCVGRSSIVDDHEAEPLDRGRYVCVSDLLPRIGSGVNKIDDLVRVVCLDAPGGLNLREHP